MKDWSTSIGSSFSVLVGDGAGEEKRVEGKDSISGDDENVSMIAAGSQIDDGGRWTGRYWKGVVQRAAETAMIGRFDRKEGLWKNRRKRERLYRQLQAPPSCPALVPIRRRDDLQMEWHSQKRIPPTTTRGFRNPA